MTDQPTPRAFSYLRFSTPEQSKGDSFRRQASMAAKYAAERGLDLDASLTFHDVGVSAFRGQNAEAGKLAYFLEAVESGLVPQGSVLLVEQLDRLSRLTPRKALRVLERIVEAGVSVVTLNDQREYTAESLDRDPLDLLVSLLTFIRANEESATKSKRLKAAWEAKRAKARTMPLTRRAPAWLELDRASGTFRVIEDRAAIVRRIFDGARTGIGQNRLAETFNREGIKPWGSARHWQASYIVKILGNPAVIGTMTPHIMEYDGTAKKRRALEPIEGYFPAIVSDRDWAEVQVIRAGNRAVQRGRHAAEPVSNVLGGMATCHVCGGTMTRVNKGYGPKGGQYLVCAGAKVGAGCAYKSVRYQMVEDAIRLWLSERLDDAPAGSDDTVIETELRNAEGQVSALEDLLDRAVDELLRNPSERIRDHQTRMERELSKLKERIAELSKLREVAAGALVLQRVQDLREELSAPLDRAALNLALRRVFSKAVVDYSTGLIEFEWIHGGTCEVPFMLPSD